MNVSVSVWFTS